MKRAPKAPPPSHARALARGRAAALKGTPNPYAHGTQCWILFEKGRGEAAANRP